jgi:hypothetical protein
MAKIISEYGDDLYSLSTKGYNTLDLFLRTAIDNGIENLQGELPVGATFVFLDSLYDKNGRGLRLKKTIVDNTALIESTHYQNWIDLLLMGYGSFDRSVMFLMDNKIDGPNEGSVKKNVYRFDRRLTSDTQYFTKLITSGTYYATGFEDEVPPPTDGCFILTEEGFYFLQEDGFRTLVEVCNDRYILTEEGFYVLQEDDFKMYIE